MSVVAQHLTVCVLVKNDETRISQAIRSAATLGARVLIIDGFSEDNTFQNAQLAWTESKRDLADFEFVSREFVDPVRVRQDSFGLVKTRWVLWLDSDEWIDEDLHLWMKDHLEYLDFDNVYAFHRRSYFLNRPLHHGEWYPDNCARLCRVGHAQWKLGRREMPISETLIPTSATGKTVVVDAHIGHLPFENIEELNAIHDSLETQLGKELAEHWHSVSQKPYGKFMQHRKVLAKFLEKYFLQKGFLDGSPGWILAKSAATGMKSRIAKARDLYWVQSS